MKKLCGEKQENTPAEEARKKVSSPVVSSDLSIFQHCIALWEMKDTLSDNLTNKQIVEFFKANTNNVPDKINNPVVLQIVADGLLYGRYAHHTRFMI